MLLTRLHHQNTQDIVHTHTHTLSDPLRQWRTDLHNFIAAAFTPISTEPEVHKDPFEATQPPGWANTH